MTTTRSVLLAGCAFAALLNPLNKVFAQESDSAQAADEDVWVFEEIVITARKREESIYDSPMAISAFSTGDIERLNMDDLFDLGKNVPNVVVNTFGNGNLSHAGIFIRGIGLSDHWITRDPGVAVYVDGVYLGRQMGANLGLPNIARIEVARGPQGTLNGRNSLGGSVNFVTRRPEEEDTAEFQLNVGTRERVTANFYGSTKLSDAVAVSLSASMDRRDGVGDFLNLDTPIRVGQIDRNSARLAFSFNPSEDFSLLVAIDGSDDKYGQTPYDVEVFQDGAGGLSNSILSDDPYDTNSNDETIVQATNKGFGLVVNAQYDHSDTLSSKVIYGHRFYEYTGGLDVAVPNNIQFPESGQARQNSLEYQLNYADESLDIVAGLFYFDEDGEAISIFDFEGLERIRPLDTFQTTTSYAAYGSVSYSVTDRLTVGGGLRYTKDEKEANASLDILGLDLGPPIGVITFNPGPERVFNEDDWDAVTWDLFLRYSLNDRLNAYALVSSGYQNGGFQPRPGFAPAAAFVSYDEQTAINYEIGLKGVVADRVELSLSAFYTDFSDLQLTADTLVPGQGFFSVITNAGASESYGFELDSVIAFTDNFRLNSSVGYLEAEYTELAPGTTATSIGNAPPNSPRWTLLVAPEYSVNLDGGGSIAASVNYSYRSSMFSDATNRPTVLIDDLSLLGFNITYTSSDESWTVGLYGKNVTDEQYINAIVANEDANGPTFNQNILSNDRSEFGLIFTKKFGF